MLGLPCLEWPASSHRYFLFPSIPRTDTKELAPLECMPTPLGYQQCRQKLRPRSFSVPVQAQTTGKTPLDNLGSHLADPWTNNVFGLEHARLIGQ